MKRITWVLLFLISLAQADEPVNLPMTGLILSSQALDEPCEALGLKILDIDIPGGESALRDRLEPIFSGKPISQELLAQLKHEIRIHYGENKLPFLIVDIPEQDVSKGTVLMVLCESTLCNIWCTGNRYFSDRVLTSYIEVEPGERIRTDRLLSDIAFTNRNPFRNTSLAFSPGAEEKTTDIILVTEDRLPLRVYVGGDNTGNKYTGDARWYTGFNYGNLFFIDHMLSYQYTTSSDFHRFQAHTAQYVAPNQFRQILTFFGGVSFVHPSLNQIKNDFMPPPNELKSHGFSAQASVRYEIPFGAFYKARLQDVVFGFDFKRMNNNLTYIGDESIPIIFKNVNLGQFVIQYHLGIANENHQFSFEGNLYASPGDILGGGSKTNFNNLRAGAKNQYIYALAGIKDTYFMPYDLALYGYLRGQVSSGALLPSEQFGLGGYDTVRGYDEREFNADQALVLNLELHSPSVSVSRRRHNEKFDDALYFLIFGDFAGGWNYTSLSNEKNHDWLGSLGAGFRYNYSRYLQARLDYGFKLHKDGAIGHSLGKLHVGLIASY